ncbi:hypothetical protein Dimus_031134 [Dionaea muscipula]
MTSVHSYQIHGYVLGDTKMIFSFKDASSRDIGSSSTYGSMASFIGSFYVHDSKCKKGRTGDQHTFKEESASITISMAKNQHIIFHHPLLATSYSTNFPGHLRSPYTAIENKWASHNISYT